MSATTKSRKSITPTASELANPLFWNAGDQMLGSLGEAGSAYLRGVVSLNREVADFINKRLEHDAELSRRLGQCKDWKEAAELQQQWAREASEEYAASARTLMELTTRIMNDTWAQIRERESDGSGSDGG